MKWRFNLFFKAAIVVLFGCSSNLALGKEKCVLTVAEVGLSHPDLNGITTAGIYEGETCNGSPAGQGVFSNNSGLIFRGFFEDALLTGNAEVIDENTDTKYLGDFINGKPHGRVEIVYGGYKSYQYYRDGKKIGKPFRSQSIDGYEGEVNDIGMPHGNGRIKYLSSNISYVGEWYEGFPHGKGIMSWESGKAIYEGEFKKGVQNGEGYFLIKGLYEYRGSWAEGKKEGLGTIVWFDDSYSYTGPFYKGFPHGEGVCKSENDNKNKKCEFRMGKEQY
ncbi:hypothetical protein ACFSJ3_04065 [Corallincola platygyrae]|uniref:MORN repeat protein n=1 Tax=Corallincola platygyrae TaxID=1193278 RepID=A0ABW4XJA9_9GAMM